MADQPPPSPSSSDPTEIHHEQPLIPALSNDVALLCLARVPRSHHPFLSLVSKSWRSILRSPLFHATRCALNTTQSFLFINLRIFNSKDSSFSFKWSMNWAEVFDPISRLWRPVRSPIEVKEKWMHASAVVDGRLYAMADRNGVIFDPGMEEWGLVSTELDLGWRGRAAVVDGVLYCYDYLGKIRGFDVGENEWKELKGVDNSLPKFLCGATMANVGGRLFVVWEGKANQKANENGGWSGQEMEVLCAEILVRKNELGELWGSIVWSDVIIVIPKGSSVVHCLDVHL
uniref:F-box family protein n=1 Tax=Chenopodium quinoa TaxID=63459 RepID=A0A803KW98_CHEQI